MTTLRSLRRLAFYALVIAGALLLLHGLLHANAQQTYPPSIFSGD